MSVHSLTPEPLVALVTGANHGIGAATAKLLASRDADVVVTYFQLSAPTSGADLPAEYYRKRSQDGSAVCSEVEGLGRRCVSIEADLTDPDAPATLLDEAETEIGPVNILVHNASGWRKDSFAEAGRGAVGRRHHPVTVESIDAQLHVDARAGALLTNEFIRRHRARRATWGRIVALTSGVGQGFPGEVSYGAAKAALISYTLSAASEMAPDGVTANIVYPPVTTTGWVTDEVRDFVAQDGEHHHIATSEEVAEVIAWLCLDAGRTVTGNIIRLR